MRKLFNVGFRSICVILLMLIFAPKAIAQQKRMLKAEDYKLWSDRLSNVSSANGDWIFFKENHKNLADTLHVKNTITGVTYNFPDLSWGAFSPDSRWFASQKKDSVYLLDLSTGKLKIYNGFSRFTFAKGYLLNSKTNQEGTTLDILDLKTMAIHSIQNIKEYTLSDDQMHLGVIGTVKGMKVVKTITLNDGFPEIVLSSNSKNDYAGLTWNKPGKSLAFYELIAEDKQSPIVKKVHVCRNIGSKIEMSVLDPLTTMKFPKGFSLATSSLYLSDDGKQLFVYLLKPKDSLVVNNSSDKIINDVKVWLPDDKEVPPPVSRPPSATRWYTWWVDTDKLIPVGNTNDDYMILTGDQKNALFYKTEEYLPQYKFVGRYMDLYIKNLSTGAVKLLVKKVLNEPGIVLVSPAGKYVSYFKDSQWWVYDISKGSNSCVTKGLNVSFEDIEDDDAGEKDPNSKVAFLDDDSGLFAADEFDIWFISPDGLKRTKITNGRNDGTVSRIYSSGYGFFSPGIDPIYQAQAISAEQGMLVTTKNVNNLDEGICWWNKKSGLKRLVNKAMKLATVSTVADGKRPFIFTESDFDVSPRLMTQLPSGREKLIFQSNPQQKEFYWGKSKLIHYNNSEGKKLKAALLYPANYDSAKKYPMIVHIYQRRARELHQYVAPTENVSDGFNPTIWTSEGYFVLLPDIVYKMNDPGISATECVTAITKKVIETGLVDKDRIGLMGGSFGGYETTFIISQTNIFKTAIAGAAVTDLVSGYLSLHNGISNMWRYDNQQMRLQTPYYGADFLRNSPLMNADKINTPLLLWHGDKDDNVDISNSMKMQIALWRMGKQSTFLTYPGEGHAIMGDAHQKDLTMRVKTWFGYYLKNEKPAEWMHIKGSDNN